MHVSAVICEYNPFHRGHAAQLQAVRDNGAEIIVCVMSGHFVQRGVPALCDKYTRAAMALQGGADLVVELPFPYCAASADFFAAAGIHVARALHADTLCFGSESNDLAYLRSAARSSTPGEGSRSFFNKLLKRQDGGPGPNDLLAMAYLRALQSTDLRPLPLPRIGADYLDESTPVTKDVYPSAGMIRRAIAAGEPFAEGIPEECLAPLAQALADGRAPTDFERLSSAYLTFLRFLPTALAGDFAECGGGIGELLCRSARVSASLGDLFENARAKHVTDAHLRRAALFALCGVKWADLEAKPAFSVLLGASGRGQSYLSSLRKTMTFPLLTKPADAAKAGRQAERQLHLWHLCDSLFVQTLKVPTSPDAFFRCRPVILSSDRLPRILDKA